MAHRLLFWFLLLGVHDSVNAQVSLGGAHPFRVIAREHQIIVAQNHSSKMLRIETRNGSREFTLPIKNHLPTSSGVDFSYFKGRMTTLALTDPGGAQDRGTLYASWDGRSWTPLAFWRDPSDRSKGQKCVPRKAFQLEDERFLLFGRFQPREHEAPCPLAIAHIDEAKRLIIHDYMNDDLGFKESFFVKIGVQYKKNKKYLSFLQNLFWGAHVIETENHIIFPSLHDGFMLLFDRMGRFKGKHVLFEDGSEGSSDTSNHISIFLSLAPLRDGRILIASPTREAVEKAAKEFKYSFHVSKFWSAGNEKAMADAVRAYPDFQWWTFDPAGGAFRPQPPPDGVPTRFAGISEMVNFAFRPRLDDSLEVTGFQGRHP